MGEGGSAWIVEVGYREREWVFRKSGQLETAFRVLFRYPFGTQASCIDGLPLMTVERSAVIELAWSNIPFLCEFRADILEMDVLSAC